MGKVRNIQYIGSFSKNYANSVCRRNGEQVLHFSKAMCGRDGIHICTPQIRLGTYYKPKYVSDVKKK